MLLIIDPVGHRYNEVPLPSQPRPPQSGRTGSIWIRADTHHFRTLTGPASLADPVRVPRSWRGSTRHANAIGHTAHDRWCGNWWNGYATSG